MIKCIAIDDEPMALTIITQFCRRMGDIQLTAFINADKGLQEIKRTKPDLVLLDIEMGETNGIELARQLPQGIFLIFTTAYAQYAVDGFELNAVDYLCKPYSFARFEKAIQKMKQLRELTQMTVKPLFTEESISVKVEYKNVNIRLADILYIESINNYIRIYLIENRSVLSQMSMKAILEILPSDRFLRIHKSYIIPLHRVAQYTRTGISLYGSNAALSVGRSYADDFMEAMSRRNSNEINSSNSKPQPGEHSI